MDGSRSEPDRSGGKSRPVDSFGRQTLWQSTAKQLLSEGEQGIQVGRQPRDPRWGGMLPGDVTDTNHGDVTRGGLDGRGPVPPESRGPTSWPEVSMEAAMEWDGSGESPWANVTSPPPLGEDAKRSGKHLTGRL